MPVNGGVLNSVLGTGLLAATPMPFTLDGGAAADARSTLAGGLVGSDGEAIELGMLPYRSMLLLDGVVVVAIGGTLLLP